MPWLHRDTSRQTKDYIQSIIIFMSSTITLRFKERMCFMLHFLVAHDLVSHHPSFTKEERLETSESRNGADKSPPLWESRLWNQDVIRYDDSSIPHRILLPSGRYLKDIFTCVRWQAPAATHHSPSPETSYSSSTSSSKSQLYTWHSTAWPSMHVKSKALTRTLTSQESSYF